MSLGTGCDRHAARSTTGGGSVSGRTVYGETPHSNRLAAETSPYLLQHASNPVDWYPWGDEAFEKAKREDKPIFLSIGYSACHWCHVMERESFENREVAAILNTDFVSIKVDREERPDVDRIYMTAVQMMTGNGGWPLSVLLTPNLKPFFGGTYFPREDRYGRPGLKSMLTQIAALWRDQKTEIIRRASLAADAISQHLDGTTRGSPKDSITGNALTDPEVEERSANRLRRAIAEAVDSLVRAYDRTWGGFGSQPKFPPSGALHLLMRQYARTGNEELLGIVTHTLERMACGGIYDQVGGGFHRYSVDRQWLVPHFEKMLYDNALMAGCYLESYRITGRSLHRRIATETLDYVVREMSDASGGFHSSEDADSEGKEGWFYLWDEDEIRRVLGPDDAPLFCRYHGVTRDGNFEGRNILNAVNNMEDFAAAENIPVNCLEKRLSLLREKLRAARSLRTRPGRDDKILASWNGLMISSLAKGYMVLGEDRFLEAAANAGQFLLSAMTDSGSRLLRTWKNDKAGLPGYLDDYANVAMAFLDLHQASRDSKWLQAAGRLATKMIELFWDGKNGGFHFSSSFHTHLLARAKTYTDDSIPSGNSTAVNVLLALEQLTDRLDYREKAMITVLTAAETVGSYPQAYSHMLCAADRFLGQPTFGGCQIKDGGVFCA